VDLRGSLDILHINLTVHCLYVHTEHKSIDPCNRSTVFSVRRDLYLYIPIYIHIYIYVRACLCVCTYIHTYIWQNKSIFKF